MRSPIHFTTKQFQEVPRTPKQLSALGVTRAEMHNYFECCTYGTWIAKPTELLWAANRSLTLDQRQRILNGLGGALPSKFLTRYGCGATSMPIRAGSRAGSQP